MVEGTVSDGLGGTYTKVSDPLFRQEMERQCGNQWSILGQWKRNQGTSRYLFVFNQKEDVISNAQRWIIASFGYKTGTGRKPKEIAPYTIMDTAKPQCTDSFVKSKFSISKQTEQSEQSHATSSARKSNSKLAPIQKQDTPETQDNERSLDVLSHSLGKAETKIRAQSEQIIAMNAHRIQLEDRLKKVLEYELKSQISKTKRMDREIKELQESQGANEEQRNRLERKWQDQNDRINQIEGLTQRNYDTHNDEMVRMQMQLGAMDAVLKESKSEIQELTENDVKQRDNIVILLCSGGGILVVIGILCAVICYKARSADSWSTEISKGNQPLQVIPRVHAKRLRLNQHPAVRDQFGMKEVFDVTAREGTDLVRIARPLETAGAERRLSEELMDIQPIIAGQEGAQSTTQ